MSNDLSIDAWACLPGRLHTQDAASSPTERPRALDLAVGDRKLQDVLDALPTYPFASSGAGRQGTHTIVVDPMQALTASAQPAAPAAARVEPGAIRAELEATGEQLADLAADDPRRPAMQERHDLLQLADGVVQHGRRLDAGTLQRLDELRAAAPLDKLPVQRGRSPRPPAESADADAGAPVVGSSFGATLAAAFLFGGATAAFDVLHAEANTRPDAGVGPTELPPGGLDYTAGVEPGLLSDPTMRTLAGVAIDVALAELTGRVLEGVMPHGVGARPRGAGPWVDDVGVTNLLVGTVRVQRAPTGCLAASGEIVTGGAVTEAQLLGTIGVKADVKDLKDALNNLPAPERGKDCASGSPKTR